MLQLAINSLITYIATLVFIGVSLYTPSNIETLYLSSFVWLLGIFPLLLAAGGDLYLAYTLIAQPRGYLSLFRHKKSNISTSQHGNPYYDEPTELQYNMVYLTYSVLLFTFIFSIFVPLDAETVLQKWPVAPLLGCFVGFLIGAIISIAKTTFFTNKIAVSAYPQQSP